MSLFKNKILTYNLDLKDIKREAVFDNIVKTVSI